MRDVLGADRLLGETAFEGAAKGRIAMRLQEVRQNVDIMNPQLWSAMRELREIGERGRAEIEQVSATRLS